MFQVASHLTGSGLEAQSAKAAGPRSLVYGLSSARWRISKLHAATNVQSNHAARSRRTHILAYNKHHNTTTRTGAS